MTEDVRVSMRSIDIPPMLVEPRELLRPSNIIIGGTSDIRAQYISKLFPTVPIKAAQSLDEPNVKGVKGVVEYKLGQALQLATSLGVEPPGRLLVASDVMVSRLRERNNGESEGESEEEILIKLEPNIGKYDMVEAIIADLEHLEKLKKHNILPVYFIHAGSGVIWELEEPRIKSHDFTIELEPSSVEELVKRETFDKYIEEMKEKFGESGALRIAGGLELGYLIGIEAVKSVNRVLIGSNGFQHASMEALHYAQNGIDPGLFALDWKSSTM